MKALWTGSDSLFLVKFPPSLKRKYIYILGMRVFAKITDLFCQEHYAVSDRVKQNLRQYGMRKPIKIHIDPPIYSEPFKKISHREFNILFYAPKRNTNPPFMRWLYGIDIFEQLQKRVKNVNWIVVDGSQDMSKVYPIVDFYIRPTRHDGAPRMVMECEINNIPYYYSEDGCPRVAEIIYKINEINGIRHTL